MKFRNTLILCTLFGTWTMTFAQQNGHVHTHTNTNINTHTNHQHSNCNDNHSHETEHKEYSLNMSSGTLTLNDIHELSIVAYDGNEVKFSADVEIHDVPDRAKGLKLLNAEGLDDNTGFGIAVVENANGATATQFNNSCDCHNIKIEVPKGIKIAIENSSINGKLVSISGVSNEIEISSNYQDLFLNDITGPVSAKTVYGEVEASFTKVNQTGAISIYSVYGYVDVSIPSGSKGNFRMSAPFGEIYSNANLEILKEGSRKTMNGNKIAGNLNGGGVDFSLKAAYGDVYLRQL